MNYICCLIEVCPKKGKFTLATAILDRLLYKCELIQLFGKNYRMANRKIIFEHTQADNKNEKVSYSPSDNIRWLFESGILFPKVCLR